MMPLKYRPSKVAEEVNDAGWLLCYSHYLYPAFLAARWSFDSEKMIVEAHARHRDHEMSDACVAILPALHYFGFARTKKSDAAIEGKSRLDRWGTWAPMFDRHLAADTYLRREHAIFSEAIKSKRRRFWHKQYGTRATMRRFLASLNAHSAFTAAVLGKKLRRYRLLVDIGAGAGTYAASALKNSRSLKVVLVDRPEIIQCLRPQFPLRASFVAADARVDEWPEDGEVYLLSHFLQDFGQLDREKIVNRAARSVSGNAELWIHGHFWEPDDVHPAHVAFSYYLFTRVGGALLSRSQQIDEICNVGFRCRGVYRTSLTQWLLVFKK